MEKKQGGNALQKICNPFVRAEKQLFPLNLASVSFNTIKDKHSLSMDWAEQKNCRHSRYTYNLSGNVTE